MRYFLELAYHGKAYHGWQRQPNAVAVQEVVENAFSTFFQDAVEVVGAGRTDAGVHSRQLFAHVDLEQLLPKNFIFKLNSLLPKDIAIHNIHSVPADAHARFDAVSRTYEYHIIQKKDPFAVDTAYFIKAKLDVERMNEAAAILLKYTNFKSFSRSRTDVKTYECELEYAYWEQEGDKLIFNIKANRFLRNMVRAIVGTLVEIGLYKMEIEKMHEIIKGGCRSEAGASAPAHALYLTRIEYPKDLLS